MISVTTPAEPVTKRMADGQSPAPPTLANSACTIAATVAATAAASATASSAPVRRGSRDRARRDTHSSTDTESAIHSAKPLVESTRGGSQCVPASGTSTTTTTTSWAMPSIAASRGSRQRSGSQGSSARRSPMAQPASKRFASQSPRSRISSAQTECGIG